MAHSSTKKRGTRKRAHRCLVALAYSMLSSTEPGSARSGRVGFGVAEKASAGATYTKAGYGVCDVDGYGVSASIAQETGAGVSGLVAAGASASVQQDTGYGTAGLVGAGTSASVHVESGSGVAGLVGSGADAVVDTETGYGTVGTFGAGVSAFVSGSGNTYTKSGYAVCGLVGSGADVATSVESGYGVSGLVGAGASASVHQETGYAVVGTVGSGASASVFQKSGYGTAGCVGSGSLPPSSPSPATERSARSARHRRLLLTLRPVPGTSGWSVRGRASGFSTELATARSGLLVTARARSPPSTSTPRPGSDQWVWSVPVLRLPFRSRPGRELPVWSALELPRPLLRRRAQGLPDSLALARISSPQPRRVREGRGCRGGGQCLRHRRDGLRQGRGGGLRGRQQVDLQHVLQDRVRGCRDGRCRGCQCFRLRIAEVGAGVDVAETVGAVGVGEFEQGCRLRQDRVRQGWDWLPAAGRSGSARRPATPSRGWSGRASSGIERNRLWLRGRRVWSGLDARLSSTAERGSRSSGSTATGSRRSRSSSPCSTRSTPGTSGTETWAAAGEVMAASGIPLPG